MSLLVGGGDGLPSLVHLFFCFLFPHFFTLTVFFLADDFSSLWLFSLFLLSSCIGRCLTANQGQLTTAMQYYFSTIVARVISFRKS